MKKLTTESFIERAEKVFSKRFDYSKTNYVKMSEKVQVNCREHGAFLTSPQSHLKGIVSCGDCNNQKPITKKVFLSKAKTIWGEDFDYSKTGNFSNGKTIIKITCKKHSHEFKTTPIEHLKKKNGCKFCQSSGKLFSKETLIVKAKEKNIFEKFDYSLVPKEFSVKEKVSISCLEHGGFEQSAENHLIGKIGCESCNKNNRLSSTLEFIQKSQKIFGEKYDYSKTEIVNGLYGEVVLVCREHGEFSYLIKAHLRGLEGCLKCRRKFGPSRGELELANYIRSCTSFLVVQSDRKLLKGKELDIYIPELKLAFEYNGEYWHSEEMMMKNTGKSAYSYHSGKIELCSEEKVKLYYIWEKDWKNNRVETEEMVKNIIRKAEKELASSSELRLD